MSQSSSESQSHSQEKKTTENSSARKLSRRMFFAFLGAGAATMAGWKFSLAQSQEKQGAAAFGEQLKPVETTSIMELEGLKLFLDKEGFPVSYKLNNGETKAFSANEVQRMKDARDLSEATGEVEVATQVIEYQQPETNDFSQERPHVTTAPERLLSPEQLAAQNIEVINPTKSDDVQLQFTQDIFENTGLLEPFTLLNEQLPDEEKKKLIIAVLNGGFVTKEFASDPAYDKVRNILAEMKEEIMHFIRQQITEYYQYMDFVRREIHENKDDPEFSKRFVGKVLRYKSLVLLYTQTLSEEELINEFYFRNEHFYNTGQYHHMPFFNENNSTDSVIFIASPDLKATLSRRYYTINCSPDGIFGINIVDGKDSFDGKVMVEAPAARVDQGFPQPDDVRVRSSRSFDESELTAEQAQKKKRDIYRYDFWSGGIVRHELVHFLLMNILPELAKKGLIDQSECARLFFENEEVKKYFEKWGQTDESFPPINNEAVTDQLAYDTLVSAWKKWEESNYTDPSGFYVVFKVPDSEILPGGYQLTDAPNSNDQRFVSV